MTFGLLVLLVGGCISSVTPTTTTRPVTSAPGSIPGVSRVSGIKADVRLLTSSGETTVLEVTVDTLIRQMKRSCPGQSCPEKLNFRIKSSVLVDYRRVAVADASSLLVDNEAGAESSVAQVLTVENTAAGNHCVAAFSQILPVDAGTVVGKEGLIGYYDHLDIDFGQAKPSASVTKCSTAGLVDANGTFVSTEGPGCGGLPNGITTDLAGTKLPDDEVMVLVPTCPQDLVAVILKDGEMMPEATRLVVGHDSGGFVAYVMPRVAGRWRVVTLPVARYRGTVPDESPYWDVVISPPREF